MILSPVENLSYVIGTAEPHLQRAIRKYAAPGATAYDVGANVGYVSLSLAKKVGPSGHVAAFEPVPRSVGLLRNNIENNHLANIEVFEVAASNRKGEAIIRVSENFATASLIWHKGDSSALEVAVKTVAIDDLVEAGALAPPNFVKIDVEGAEGLVLLGMQKTIASARPVLFVECSDAGRETAWQLLKKLDYCCQSALTGTWVDRFEDYRHSDFLWLPLPS